MELRVAFLVLTCALWRTESYPTYYPYYGPNVDAISFGANHDSQRAMTYSHYYKPYTRALGGGMAAFMFEQPQQQSSQTNQGYYLPDRRRQTIPETHYLPPQQNEVYYPQSTEKVSIAPTQQTEAIPTVQTELTTQATPELSDTEDVEETTPKSKKNFAKTKPVRKPVEDEDPDEYVPRMPMGTYFPMFFGWGGRSGGAPGGATAIANAYSTGRGGVASSHATAYGSPRPDEPSHR